MALSNPVIQAALVSGVVALLVTLIPRLLPSRLDRASAMQQNIETLQTVIETLRKELEDLKAWQKEHLLADAERDQKDKEDEALMRLMIRRWNNVVRTVPAIGASVSDDGIVSIKPGQRALVVDDDRSIRTVIGEVLLSEGLVPIIAEDADQALALAATSDVSLAIVDLYLLGPHSSDWLIHSLRALPGRAIPIIIMTAATDADAKRRILALNPIASFTKPFDIDSELLPQVRTALAKREEQARTAASGDGGAI